MYTFNELRSKIWHSKSASIIIFWSILVVCSSIKMISCDSITYVVIYDYKSGCIDHTVHSFVKRKYGIYEYLVVGVCCFSITIFFLRFFFRLIYTFFQQTVKQHSYLRLEVLFLKSYMYIWTKIKNNARHFVI